MASQQNAACQQCRAALVGLGGGSAVVCQFGVSGGSEARGARAAQRAWSLVAGAAYCTPTAQTSCGSASPSPIELRGTWKAGTDRHALSLAHASGRALASGGLA